MKYLKKVVLFSPKICSIRLFLNGNSVENQYFCKNFGKETMSKRDSYWVYRVHSKSCVVDSTTKLTHSVWFSYQNGYCRLNAAFTFNLRFVYTERQHQRCDNAAMTLAKLLWLETMELLQIGGAQCKHSLRCQFFRSTRM